MKSEKPYKQIEDKIIAAADAPDYAFNEASWKKMEALLDKYQNRHRPFFWIFGFLLLGAFIAGGGIIYQSIMPNKKSVITTKQAGDKNDNKQPLQSINSEPNTKASKQPDIAGENTINSNTVTVKTNSNFDLIDDTNTKSNKINIHNTKTTKQAQAFNFNSKAIANFKSNSSRLKNFQPKNTSSADNYNAINKNIYKDRNKFAVNITAPDTETDATDEPDNKTATDKDNYLAVTKTDSTTAALTKSKRVDKEDAAAKKTNPTITTKTTEKKEKSKKKVSGFYVFGSVGAEASSTKLFSYKNSTIAPVYALGLGYQLNRRLSVQAGFYAAAKKYSAGPNDYNVKAGSYLSMVKIIKVDANCMVYQVPVTLQYNWLIKPRANYYAAVGLSSYIMKKEKYNYTYVRNNYQYSYPYDYTNNSHLAASLQFSLGMEKQIGRKFYLQAAPVVNIPLKGVGEGRVKIFTIGLQVGLKYFPFKN